MFRMKIIFPLLLLFVARLALSSNLNGSLILSSHSGEPTEGDTVEITCNIHVTSPAGNRSKFHYFWTMQHSWPYYQAWISYTNSSGPAVDTDGNIRPGYSFKDDGRTLVIDSVQYHDAHFSCRGIEDGETSGDEFQHYHQIKYKPYIFYLSSEGKKVNTAINESAVMVFGCKAYPPYSKNGSWTFVNSVGVSKNLPPNSVIAHVDVVDIAGAFVLLLQFISSEYYGNYSYTVSNVIGSTTVTFQVLPEGPPDAPSNVRIQNVTNDTIVVEWNVMWSNSNDEQQTVCWQLTQVENGTIVESSNKSYNYVYNRTYRYRFEKNILPGTKYTVSVWSINKLGKSQVIEMEVETQKDPNLILSPSPISLWALLGITPIALIAGLLAYLVKRFKQNRQPQQLSRLKWKPLVEEVDVVCESGSIK